MSKTIQVSFISNRLAFIFFGGSIIANGANYFYYPKQIRPLLPDFFPGGIYWMYLIGTAFILAGIAIMINKQITIVASLLLAILLFGLAIAIDLRGIFNEPDEVKYLFSQALFKDLGLVAGAIIIANFEREIPAHRRGRHRRRSSGDNSKPFPPSI